MKKRGFGLLILLLLLVLPLYVKAENKEEQLSELIIHTSLNNAKIEIFKVASVIEDEYVLNNNFNNYPINCHNITYADDYRSLAYTLEGYIKKDKIKADYESFTNQNGLTNIKSLKKGLYLIMMSASSKDKYNYASEPIIIDLPYKNYEGTYESLTNIYLKSILLDTIGDYYDKEININWLDKGFGNYRPKEVTVELLENSLTKKEIVLSKDNNWHSTIKNLKSNKSYNIVIRDLNYYEISINDDYDQYTIYSTFNKKSIIDRNVLIIPYFNNYIVGYHLVNLNLLRPLRLISEDKSNFIVKG